MGSISAVINISGVHEKYSIWAVRLLPSLLFLLLHCSLPALPLQQAYEGFGWIATFSTMFTTLFAGWKYINRPREVTGLAMKEREANAPLVV
jgi:membrane protease YdiL (CAAX protease family)